MTGTEALEIIATFLKDEPVVLANGYISREFLMCRTGKKIFI